MTDEFDPTDYETNICLPTAYNATSGRLEVGGTTETVISLHFDGRWMGEGPEQFTISFPAKSMRQIIEHLLDQIEVVARVERSDD